MRAKKKFRSLGRSLMFWFLILSLLPMTLVVWFSFQLGTSSLTRAAEEKLEQSAVLNVRFIKSWFNYRFMELNIQAESSHSVELLSQLVSGLQNNDNNPGTYVKSDDWAAQVSEKQNYFITLSRRYDYIYDIYLLDTQGNILFSIAAEADLGTNLFTGPYANTRFAKSVESTLQTGQSLFSDLEHYAPSRQTNAGFLTAQILNESGKKLGILAVQINVERIINSMTLPNSNRSLIHYLVGDDKLLRSSLKFRESKFRDGQINDVLERVIDTEQVQLWRQEQNVQGESGSTEQLAAKTHKKSLTYTGPDGQQVIGIHNSVKLPGADWVLISEIDQKEALVDAIWLGEVTIAMLIVTALLVVLLAIYLSRRITGPIIKLSQAAMMIAGGDTSTQVDIAANNEIGRLGSAFNHMLLMQQKHKRALQQSTEHAQHLLAELEEEKFALDQHSIVAVTDVSGNITHANELFAQISGYSVPELLGKNHSLLNSGAHDGHFWQEMYGTVADGRVWHNEVCNRAKDGHLYWLDTTIVPFKDDNGEVKSYIAIRTDITENKRIERALIEAKEAAEAAVRAKGEFLASMSHEIRTPMNGVLGMLGLLLDTDLDDEQRHRLILAQSSANGLLNLINDILDFSKIEAGKLELETLDFDLRSMLGEFAEAMAFQAQEKGLEVVLDVTNIEHSMVRGDPGRLRQILINLVGNAIKFTEQGEVIIFLQLLPHNEQQFRLHGSVSDTGIGIPADKLEQLFDSFSQVDASTTRKYGGTGLGLTIAKNLCVLMKGDIQVTSESGQGSCFEFNVLIGHSEQSQLVVPNIDISKLNLLVVDNNATNREVLRTQFEHWGATVVEAEDGPSALAVCESRIQQRHKAFFDIAFLDMQMPDMDGAALGRALKKDARFKSMRLVMMTSMSHQGDGQFFSQLGFSAYFPKPATTFDLFDALSVVAEGGDALQQAQPLVTHHYLKTLADNGIRKKQETSKAAWSTDTRLLLVEDNRVNQLVAKGILNNFGLQVNIAVNGLDALDKLQQADETAPYTLLFMDCQMPQMDGYETSRQIRSGNGGERYQAIPIIAMTANAMQGDREKCLAAGMSDYLSKPIDPDRVYAKLSEWLSDRGNQTSTSGTISRFDKVSPDDNENKHSEKAENELVAHSAIEDLPDWDKTAALKRAGGETKRLLPLIELFLEDMPVQLDLLQQALDSRNMEQIRRTAHTIKGVSANLSGLRVQQLAAQMEALAKASLACNKEQQPEQLMQLMSELVKACQHINQLMQQYQAEHSMAQATQQTFLTNEQLTTLLQTLAEKLQQGDYIDIQDLQPLLAGSSDESIQVLLKSLREQIAQFDSPEALQTIYRIGATRGFNVGSSQLENN